MNPSKCTCECHGKVPVYDLIVNTCDNCKKDQGLSFKKLEQTVKNIKKLQNKERSIDFELQIKSTFGSDFQEDSATSSLVAMLTGWQMFYENAHKKNRIKFTITKNKREVKK